MNRLATRVVEGADVVVFDADGTLRRTTVEGQPCPRKPGEWELLPAVAETLGEIDWSERRLGIASNQDQVGYGLISPETANAMFRDLVSAAVGDQVREPVVRFCPHRLEIRCGCRKPSPGLLLDIMQVTGAEPDRMLFVGDSEVDQGAARAAGVGFVWAADFFGWSR
jgi:histidinol-phosphate phosphatase family protein